MKTNKQIVIGLGLVLIIAVVFVGGVLFSQKSSADSSVLKTQNTQNTQNTQDTELSTSAKSGEAVELKDSEEDSESDVDWDALPTTNVTLTNEILTITEAGTYVLTGETNAGVVVNSSGNVRLALNGAKIVSTDGAAITIESADNTFIHLIDGSENYLEDAATRSDQEIDGTIYSADDLIFTGAGKLSVKSNYADGVVSKDDLTIYSGTLAIDSADEGIRGKDSVFIKDGSVSVTSKDDGIKATNDTDLEKGYVHITGGSVLVSAADDAIKAVTSIVIDGGDIDVTSSLEGLEATNITINNGDIVIVAVDDGINAVSDGLGGDVYIRVCGGNIDVTVGSGDTDAFDANGSIYISGGTIKVTAPTSSFDYDGVAEMTGGTLVVNGQQLNSIPVSHMGGPGGGGGFRP